MELRDVPDPVIEKDTDVLLQTAIVGICGSDVHYYTTGRIGSQVVEYPFQVGHEFSAIVAATGSQVTRVKIGDKVAVDPAMPCRYCDQCLTGREHTCRDLRFLGCPGQAAGCLSEYVVMPETSCFPIGPNTTLEQAVLAEPLSIGIYAAQLEPLQNKSIGILGCGPIGISVMLASMVEGANPTYITDKLYERLVFAERVGATWTGNPADEDVVAGIRVHEPQLLDAVFECCGEQDALDQAIDLLKPGGTLFIAGIPVADRVSFAIDTMRRKEIRIQNIRRQNNCMRPALDLIDSGKINVTSMLTHRFPVDCTKEAFDIVADYRDGVMKAILTF